MAALTAPAVQWSSTTYMYTCGLYMYVVELQVYMCGYVGMLTGQRRAHSPGSLPPQREHDKGLPPFLIQPVC